jgi:hypothetical protein
MRGFGVGGMEKRAYRVRGMGNEGISNRGDGQGGRGAEGRSGTGGTSPPVKSALSVDPCRPGRHVLHEIS